MSSLWVVRGHTPAAAGSIALYCFHHAGGFAHGFLPWQRALGPRIDVHAVQLPGRGARFAESPAQAFDALIATLAAELPLDGDRPFAFLGHSLGALVAFELARLLALQGRARPLRLFVSGAEGPTHLRPLAASLADAPDARLQEALREFEGTPPELFANPELLALVLPVFRADMSLLRSYVYRPGPPLATPITVLTGRRDPGVDAARAQDWRHESLVGCEMETFDGGHFFIDSAREAVVRKVREALAEGCPGP